VGGLLTKMTDENKLSYGADDLVREMGLDPERPHRR
jgi:hypothetical protein